MIKLTPEEKESLFTSINNMESNISSIFSDGASRDEEISRQYRAILNGIGEIKTEFDAIKAMLKNVPKEFTKEADKVVEAASSTLSEVTDVLDTKPVHVIKKEIGFFRTIFRRKNA